MSDPALRDEAVSLLRDLIRADTSNPPGRETPAAVVLRDYLQTNGAQCGLGARAPDGASVVAGIRGGGGGPAPALVGHPDVGRAAAQGWQHPPFDGHLDDEGYVWGRGAVDMKNE